MKSSPRAAIALKLADSMRLIWSRSRASPTRTLIARCSIHALLRPGLYALMLASDAWSSASACNPKTPSIVWDPSELEGAARRCVATWALPPSYHWLSAAAYSGHLTVGDVVCRQHA